MGSALQMVQIYESLAAQDEAMADRILSALNGLPCEFQERQVERAKLLRHDAQFLRALAAALRVSCPEPAGVSALEASTSG